MLTAATVRVFYGLVSLMRFLRERGSALISTVAKEFCDGGCSAKGVCFSDIRTPGFGLAVFDLV